MIDKKIVSILEKSKSNGWVLEPDALSILKLAGLDVPEYTFAETAADAIAFAGKYGYPVVAKVVSPEILHKSDVGGVALGLDNDDSLKEAFDRFSRMNRFKGMVVARMLSGTELIIGAKNDAQFGPVILMGIGGVGVEIYKDTAIRMAPLKEKDVVSMVSDIKGHKLIEGFRGSQPVDMESLASMLIGFSNLAMKLKPYIESIDLNPVICSGSRCVIADARIILQDGISKLE